MRHGVLDDPGAISRTLEESGEILFAHVMPPALAASRIARHLPRREEPLPTKFPLLVRILAFQRVGQVDRAEPHCQILLMQASDRFDLRDQGLSATFRQHGDAVLLSPASPDHDVSLVDADVLDSQPTALAVTQSRSVHQLEHQLPKSQEQRPQPSDLFTAQHHRQPLWLGRRNGVQEAQFALKHLLIQKQQGALGLVLSVRSHVALHCQLRQERLDLSFAKLTQILAAAMADEPADPARVSPFRLQRFPPHTHLPPQLLQALRLVRIDLADQLKFVFRPRPRSPCRADDGSVALIGGKSLQNLAGLAQAGFRRAEHHVAIRLHGPHSLQPLPSRRFRRQQGPGKRLDRRKRHRQPTALLGHRLRIAANPQRKTLPIVGGILRLAQSPLKFHDAHG